MNPIRIHTTINSETLHLPELRPLMGKVVEIVITEEPAQAADSERWNALAAAAGQDLIDADVYRKQREFDQSCSEAAPVFLAQMKDSRRSGTMLSGG